MTFTKDVALIGGGGHVGLPLALLFADCGMQTVIYDVNAATVARIARGEMPFLEDGADELLGRVLAAGRLDVCATPEKLRDCRYLVLIVGTPIDEHLNPSFDVIHRALLGCREFMRDGQTIVLRSTVFPGTSDQIRHLLADWGLKVGVAFCPERVAQGQSLREFREIPQIISAFDPATLAEVRALFAPFSTELIEMQPLEAELAKLFTNAWRYIQFAAANQFFMIANQHGLDFQRILHGCRHKYPRMSGMPGPGFAAGPCLVKDTMQLAAFSQNSFVIGHAAMLINEGFPYHLIQTAKARIDLRSATAGILGMAFKAESDDPRDSLSFKLRKLLMLEAKKVLCADPYVKDERLVPEEEVIGTSDVLFVGVPHKRYRQLTLPREKIVVDVWNCLPKVTDSP